MRSNMIEQLAMELEEPGLTNNNTSLKSTQFLKTNKIVFVYIIENLASQKKYVGISSEPLSRISSHLNGGGSAELFKEHKLKESDFDFRVLESFVDNDFSPSNTQSVAHHVEALMIAF